MSDLTAPDYALIYMGYGERPVPIPGGEKGPKIKEWTTKQFELTDFLEGDNIGLRMGPNDNSEFRVALDFDFDVADPERYNKSKSILLLLAETDKLMLSKGRRGYTGHFIADTPVDNQSYENLKLDLLSTGKQTVVAPSTVDSITRVWEPAIDDWVLPTINTKELLKVLALANVLGKYLAVDGTRNTTALGLGAFVRERELDADFFKKALVVALLGSPSKNIEDHLRVFDKTGTDYHTLPPELYQELNQMFKVVKRKSLMAFSLDRYTKVELMEFERGSGPTQVISISCYDEKTQRYNNVYVQPSYLSTFLIILKSIKEELNSEERTS